MGGLTSAQWAALRYFSRANRFSRTVSAFADFHSTTRGTASQTVKSLVRRGLLSRSRSDRDGRSIRFDLTDQGRSALRQDPFETLVGAVVKLPQPVRRQMGAALEQMLDDMARERGKRPFGMCTACAFLSHDGDPSGRPQFLYRCELVGDPLEVPEIRQVCVNFRSAAQRAEDRSREPVSSYVPGANALLEGVPIP